MTCVTGPQPTIGLTSPLSVELYLTSFIRWVLRVTASGEYTGDRAIELLDQAWVAQKLLWQIREANANPSLPPISPDRPQHALNDRTGLNGCSRRIAL